MRKLGTLLMSGLLLAMMATPAGAFLGSPGRQILEELPDPNVPLAPEVVTINEDGGPRAYVRVPNPEPEAGEGEYVYIAEDEVPLAEAPVTDDVPVAAIGSDDDGSDGGDSADGFGGPSASIDISPGADAGMSTGSTGGFPIVPVAGTAAGCGIAWWLLLGSKLFTIQDAVTGQTQRVTAFVKLMSKFKKK